MPLLKDKSDFQIAIETVQCPRCLSQPGERCVLASGFIASSCHNERLRAAGFGSARNELPKPEWRFFTIPGNGKEEWDPEIHGQEIQGEDDPRCGVPEFAEVSWVPGKYEFIYGACGSSYLIQVPEADSQSHPTQVILQGFHEFLRVVHDETFKWMT